MLTMFRQLELAEQQRFIAWARQNYKPGTDIRGYWHPVVQAECVRMNEQAMGTKPAAALEGYPHAQNEQA